MSPQKSGRSRSASNDFPTILFEDRRLFVGALIYAAAALIAYALVRHLGIVA